MDKVRGAEHGHFHSGGWLPLRVTRLDDTDASPAPFFHSQLAYLKRLSRVFLANFLLLGALMGLVLAGAAYVYRETVQIPRLHTLATLYASQVGGMVWGARALPPGEREDYLQTLGRLSGGLIHPDDPARTHFATPEAHLVRQFVDTIRALLPSITVAYSEEPRLAVWVALPVEDGRTRWVSMGLPPVANVPAAFFALGVLVLALLASAVAVGLIQRMQRRDAWLAQALDSVDPRSGLPSNAPLVPATHQEDLLRLDQHFEQMAARLAEADTARALMLQGLSCDLQRLVAQVRDSRTQGGQAARCGRHLEEMERIASQFHDFAHAPDREPVETVDLNELLTELVEAARHGGQGDVALQLGGLPYAQLRRHSIRRMLGNLLDNALRHGGAGAEVRSSLEEGRLVVRVLDRGPGMSCDELAQAGRPFFRTEAARSRGTGTGLGLAVARSVAESHGGSLRVVPRPGGGLQAEVRLPCARLA